MMRIGFGGARRAHHNATIWASNPKSDRCFRFPARSRPFSDDFSVLGLSPFASKFDVKQAYKRLALKYHPDVIRGDNLRDKQDMFKDIKSAYEVLFGSVYALACRRRDTEYSLMNKFEVEESQVDHYDEYDDWEEWMGFEGGTPVVYNSF
ncbi:hypothetical protein Scep_002923 [Stephania cephalantha]|uniref:J domain-containing protein n=1 Tax=Stephania cephalantha TaxID=152367 RepID=A0AAP0LCG4_9MAGN